MESIDILTGQHVAIKYEPASVVARMGALLLDYFFMSVYFFALLYTLFELEDSIKQLMRHSEGITYTLFVIIYLPFVAYHFIFESLTGGKTLGKMIVKIQVTRMDGSVPGIGAYFLRWLLMPVDMFPSGGIGALFIVFSSYHQRIGDMAAGTIVVKTNPSLKMDLDET
ncbi:MAG: RDD family protein, partial [Spirochaetia bacterium]|nr:RDD family protein [Spirochaetia bacterium]